MTPDKPIPAQMWNESPTPSAAPPKSSAQRRTNSASR